MNAEMCTFKLLKLYVQFRSQQQQQKVGPPEKERNQSGPSVLRLLQCPALHPRLCLESSPSRMFCRKGRARKTQAFRDYMTLGSDPVHLMQRNQHASGGKKIYYCLTTPP